MNRFRRWIIKKIIEDELTKGESIGKITEELFEDINREIVFNLFQEVDYNPADETETVQQVEHFLKSRFHTAFNKVWREN